MNDEIRVKLLADSCDCRAFELLGDNYFTKNVNKAYLCYEMASFYDVSSTEKSELDEKMAKCRREDAFCVNPVSIVILSYNNMNITVDCIESVRKHNPSDSYELVVVDNASTDGVTLWLDKQSDIRLIKNEKNMGFGYGCNQGVEASSKNNDILFLNNDTILCENSLFWLRMGLYENDTVGATGSITNEGGNFQKVYENCSSIEEWLDFGKKNNVYEEHPYEEKISLLGFAMLIKRSVIDKVGLFDLRYEVGNYEDNDLGMRILAAGYKQLLCHNSFIFHYGRMAFKQGPDKKYLELMNANCKRFVEKWGFDSWDYNSPDMNLIGLINVEDKEKQIRILEIGCGMGTTLMKLKYLYPNAYVCGMEENETIVEIAGKTRNISRINYDNCDFSEVSGKFDYIIFGEVTSRVRNLDLLIGKAKNLLADTGTILFGFYNIMHGSVLLPLINGDFDYTGKGIIRKDSVSYYTLKSVLELMKRNNLRVDNLEGVRANEEIFNTQSSLWNYLKDGLGDDFEQQCITYRFILSTSVM